MTTLILGYHVHPTNYLCATNQVIEWAEGSQQRYVCAANVHMVMEAWDDPSFRQVVNSADMVTPDGMPLVWMLRLKGEKKQQRVYGPTLMLRVLEMAANKQIPVGFYGGKPEVLDRLVSQSQRKYPALKVVYAFSPPFRPLSLEEDDEVCQEIQKSGARILFVGLGCPKQEHWMFNHRDQIPGVMLGVGAAFDFHAGVMRQAPGWMQKAGLEWLFRLIKEPGRLWKRYLLNNPRFIVLALADLLGFLKTNQ